MENNYDTLDRIHRYLQGQMSPEEARDFEQQLATDTTLGQTLEVERRLLRGLQLAGDAALQKKIAAVDETLEAEGFFRKEAIVKPITSTSKVYFTMRKMLAAAAVAIILIGIVWVAFFRQAPVDRDAAFAKYYQPESTRVKDITASLESMGMAGVLLESDSLREALLLYQNYRFEEAQVALDTFLAQYPENDTARFYLALTHLQQSRYARAAEILLPLSQNESFTLHRDASWYLGLCTLKFETGQNDAIAIFEKLAKDYDYDKQKDAKGMVILLKKE
jgi:TolA-binding protein